MFVFVDLFILLTTAGLARAGWRRGLAAQAIDVFGFGAALLLAVRLHAAPAEPFRWVGVSEGWASLWGGLVVFVPLIVAVAWVGAKVGRVMMQPGLRMTNKVLGVAFGVATAAVVLTFVLIIGNVAPVPLGLAQAAARSPLGGALLDLAAPVQGPLRSFAETDGRRMVLFLRSELGSLGRPSPGPSPGSGHDEVIRIAPAPAMVLVRDAGAERELFRRVNAERTKRGLGAVQWDERMARVGLEHSRDMYVHGTFGHPGSDGSAAAQRVGDAGITYRTTGENLALAPSVVVAHDGLMRSPGHRRNILDPAYTRLGIGILAGPLGLMASQEFCGGC